MSSMLRILTPVWNAEPYIARCIATIKQQSVQDWKCYIMDDLSTDGTYEVAVRETQDDPRFEVIRNTAKLYPGGNYHQIVAREEVLDDDIMLNLDGDDWLPDPFVFRRILRAYRDPDVWITWGSFLIDANGKLASGTSLPCDLTRLRTNHFWASHLKTWRAFLFRQIALADLQSPEGGFWSAASDMSYMIPMLEMAGYQHSRYLPEPNYIYNSSNPENLFRVRSEIQQRNDRLIRSKPKYTLLDHGVR